MARIRDGFTVSCVTNKLLL